MIKDRFVVYDKGLPLLGNEYEVHIRDLNNEDNLIIIKSGYSIEEPTMELANEILSLLNGKANI